MSHVIPTPRTPALKIRGSQKTFPVRRIYCVGRNYADHAVEMGHDPNKEPPFFFTKPADAIVPGGGSLRFPVATADLHHEIELVVALSSGGLEIPADEALSHVYGYGVGLDMTRRDLQAVAKKMGRPWDMAKGFDQSAPMSELVPASEIGHPSAGAIWLEVDGVRRQSGDLDQQIWKVAETISHLSTLVELAPGDLIMTGTPAGVNAVSPGSCLRGRIDGVGEIEVRYRAS
ncbi:MAG: fumarylacetoacetate hydrolase family protein [Trueperaceae bacterium]